MKFTGHRSPLLPLFHFPFPLFLYYTLLFSSSHSSSHSTGKFYTALELTYFIKVTDGSLNMTFQRIPGQHQARICSLAVRSVKYFLESRFFVGGSPLVFIGRMRSNSYLGQTHKGEPPRGSSLATTGLVSTIGDPVILMCDVPLPSFQIDRTIFLP